MTGCSAAGIFLCDLAVLHDMRRSMPRLPRTTRFMAATISLLVLAPSTAASSEPLSAFFQALQAAETKASPDAKARIAWWGDSAIVTDGYTGQLRTRLQTKFGDGGPGFMLAAATFKGYRNRRARVLPAGWRNRGVLFGGKDARFGYGGVSSLGFAGAHTTYVSKGAAFDGTLQVFYETGPKGGNIALFLDKRGTPQTHNTRTENGRFDRIWTLPLPKATPWLRVRAGKGGAVRVYGVALEQKGPGVVIDTVGFLGLRGRRLLKNQAAHHVEQIKARKPNLLVSAFGGNERVDGMGQKKHLGDMLAVMARLKKGAPDASCLFFAPLPHGVRKRGVVVLDRRLDHIFAAQKDAAARMGCAYLNPSDFFGADADAVIRKWRADKWISGDLAHLTGTGHKKVGDAIADWLLKRYEAWKAGAQASSSP